MSAASGYDEVLGAAPPPLVVPDARARIRAGNVATGRRIAVLDDDPTGSQAVHDVSVVTLLEPAEYAAALADPGSTCFVLTNSRSLSEDDAVRLVERTGHNLQSLGRELAAPMTLVSRSDSTLRGHVVAEVRALDAAYRASTGKGYDGVLFVPAFFEAGRCTAGDVHWAGQGHDAVPVGATEFAHDPTFGYAASDLKDFVAERSGGTIDAGDVDSLSLEDIRVGGPDRVAEVLAGTSGGRFVVVNATEYADLEVVVLGLLAAQQAGRSFLHRTGPSFVRALAGIEPQGPLTAGRLWPRGAPERHGLVVVGSHVGLTSRQVAHVTARGDLVEVTLPVTDITDERSRDAAVAAAVERAAAALADDDVLLCTSRTLIRGANAAESLRIARTVSAAVTKVVARLRAARPAWVVAKGGITSHDVAVHGLGIRRATVLGQLFPGQVSVFCPVDAPAGVVGVPYVVFAGNVGDESTLSDVLDLLRGRRRSDDEHCDDERSGDERSDDEKDT